MTNGEKIKEIFPNVDNRLDAKTGIMIVKWADNTTKFFKISWWSAEYKEPSSSEIPISSEYVDRHSVDMLAYRYLKEPTDNHVAFYEDFLDLPSVTPIRPKMRWIDHSDEGYVECPKCGSATNCDDNIADLHFCFSCGAEMEGGEYDKRRSVV